MNHLFLYFFAQWLLIFSEPAGYNFPYDLTNPSDEMTPPSVLHEISGITEVDEGSIACVQDENGVLFIYDLQNNTISRHLFFGYNGDYEGVARVGKTIFVLRSDGALYEIPDYRSEESNTITYANNIVSSNNEGLCYDKAGDRLLIAGKGMIDEEDRTSRVIYAFDLKTRRMAVRPAYQFDIVAITEFAADRKLHEPYKVTARGNVRPNLLKIRTSEIAIHPITGELYMLAATDHLLLVFSRKGILQHIARLDPAKFNQAEGLTFLKNGEMLISNEGGSGDPTILRFRYRK